MLIFRTAATSRGLVGGLLTCALLSLVGCGGDGGDAGDFCAGWRSLDTASGQEWEAAREDFLDAGFPDDGQRLASGEPLPAASDDIRRGHEIYRDVLELVTSEYAMEDATGTFGTEYPDEQDAAAKYLSFISWAEGYCEAVKPSV